MGGLENILQKIEQDALDRINAINDESAQKVKALKDEIITKANAEAKEIVAEAEKKAAHISEGSKSNCETYIKRQELAAKSAVINSLLASVKDKLKGATDEEYFKDLQSLILKYALDGAGEVILSMKDADRLPKGFIDEVNKKLEGKKTRIVLQVHDELVLEVHKSEFDEVSALVKECMESVYPLLLPLTVDVEYGRSWKDE